jgi:molybdopterin molybdotransferase
MISFEEARQIVLDHAGELEPVKMELLNTLGLVLAEDVISPEKIPPFDNSAMDGFAVIARDTVAVSPENPVELTVLEDEPAGKVSTKRVISGTTVRIMTGAPIPEGADAVVKVEDTEGSGKLIKVLHPTKEGENIRRAGEDISLGETVLRRGSLFGPAEIGLLASLGKPRVKVFRPARVAIITTGDELLEIDQPLAPGKIRNSNAYALEAQVREIQAEPVPLGIVEDTKEAVTAKISEGLKKADVILTTGGVSVGEYDVVKDVMDSMGASLKFWKVAQKPGKPLAFWILKGKLVFGLPGNPVASMVCFEEYVRPAVRKMMGHQKLFRPEAEAILREDIKKKPGRLHFVRVKLMHEDGQYYASSTGPQGSGILKSMALADGLALVPPEATLLKAGDRVRVHLIGLPEDH